MALAMGFRRYCVAQNTAEELLDRTPLSAAQAILRPRRSRDVAVSGGDALSPSIRAIIRNAVGCEVFCHAIGPGGICVTGFAGPPIARADQAGPDGNLQLFGAVSRNEPVCVPQITERVTFETITGDATVIVWQRRVDRDAFAGQNAVGAAAIIGVLPVTAAGSSARVTKQLLSLVRSQAPESANVSGTFDFGTLTRELCAEIGPNILSRGVDVELIESGAALPANGNRVFMCDAVRNLIDDALTAHIAGPVGAGCLCPTQPFQPACFD